MNVRIFNSPGLLLAVTIQLAARVPSEATSDMMQLDENYTRAGSPSETDFLTRGRVLLIDFRI
jgi:hypothetical protein